MVHQYSLTHHIQEKYVDYKMITQHVLCFCVFCVFVCTHVLGFREDFDVDNLEQEPQALLLLEQMLELMHEVAFKNLNVVERVKLQHICRNLVLVY